MYSSAHGSISVLRLTQSQAHIHSVSYTHGSALSQSQFKPGRYRAHTNTTWSTWEVRKDLGLSHCRVCPPPGFSRQAPHLGDPWRQAGDERPDAAPCVLPQVSIGCPEKMEPITKISHIPASRWALSCSLCKECTGTCIQVHSPFTPLLPGSPCRSQLHRGVCLGHPVKQATASTLHLPHGATDRSTDVPGTGTRASTPPARHSSIPSSTRHGSQAWGARLTTPLQ